MNQFSYQQNKNIIDLSLFSLMKKRILQLYFQLLAQLQKLMNLADYIEILNYEELLFIRVIFAYYQKKK